MMTLGYDQPLYLLAFDHRGSFEHDLFGASEPVSAQVRDGIISVKEIIFDAHVRALTGGAPRTVVAQARAEDRNDVKCMVLGRGADEAQVIEWVKIGAAVDGFDGFAVGRTLWEAALRKFLAGQASRDEAVYEISSRYRDVINAYRQAEPAFERGRE